MKAATKSQQNLERLEARRLRAGKLFARGWSASQVAKELGVTVQSASTWRHKWEEGGLPALHSTGSRGRPPKLSRKQLRELEKILLKGSTAQGYSTPLWTLERIRHVIRFHFGVVVCISQVSRLLHRMGWSRQKPARRAKERNEALIAQWLKRDWPRIKRGH